jgi:predicted RNA methylase
MAAGIVVDLGRPPRGRTGAAEVAPARRVQEPPQSARPRLREVRADEPAPPEWQTPSVTREARSIPQLVTPPAADVRDIWSNTDFPYMCLRDRVRTEALGAEIDSLVRPGDRVLDIGAGTGILGLLALRAGADHVVAVEADPTLSRYLSETFEANGYADRTTVLQGDARTVDLPSADVVVAELIETGLMSELQVPVMNTLHRRGVVDHRTRFAPHGYRTAFELVHADRTFYGFEIRGERHEWSFYGDMDTWTPVTVDPVSAKATVWESRFDQGVMAEAVAVRVGFPVPRPGVVNAVRLSGEVLLRNTAPIGPCPSMNGDKVIDIAARAVDAGVAVVDISYVMGAGLDSLEVSWVD